MIKSDEINELAAALAKAQGELRDAPKDTQAYKYKYADLSTVLEIARPILSKHGLSIYQAPQGADINTDGEYPHPDSVEVETMLMHSSGQWISSSYTLVVEPNEMLSAAQCTGVSITYARRYALAAAIGMSQTDNDASTREGAQQPPQRPQKKKTAPPTPREDNVTGAPQGDDVAQREKNRKRIWAKAMGLFGKDTAKVELNNMCTGPGWKLSEMTVKQQDMLIMTLESLEKKKNDKY